VRSFTLALAKETQGSGVSVMTFQPGMVRTELLTGGQVIAGHEDKLSRFPRVIELLAKSPEKAAEKVVWAASAATDGKTGLEVTRRKQLADAAGSTCVQHCEIKVSRWKVHICSVPPAED
jgi:short-subunit dehydrogenase